MKKLIYLLSFIGLSLTSYAKTVVVIDAGHGGKDPGAIGSTIGIKEKDITLSISRELKALLDADPNFKAVMTRNSDNFIQLPERTEIARKNRANYLISIHADSSPSSHDMKGASVWVLSNRRANDEMGKWLEDHEKQSELLGGAGSVLSHNKERYLNQTVLDLQFSHSQRSGFELGKRVLEKLGNVANLAKSSPQHASLSVLRSPDITSILVETGFVSNPSEEQRLASISYRRQIARAIYQGLVAFRSKNAGSTKAIKELKETLQSSPKESSKRDMKKDSKIKVEEKKQNKVEEKPSYHIVQENETLYSISRMYNTTPEKLSKLNNIKDNKIHLKQKLKLK